MVQEITAFKKIDCRKLTAGRFTSSKTGVVVEKELAIQLNGRQLAVASITPSMEREFVTGYLFGQGFIDGTADISKLKIKDGTGTVTLKNTTEGPDQTEPAYRIVSGGGRSAFLNSQFLRPVQSDIKVSRRAVFQAMNILFEIAGVYRETEGTHAGGLFTAEAKPLITVEDIGRHNCLDKIIGHALINGIDCSRTLLVTTGRLASEMVLKLCRAGIPVATTKTAITDNGRETGAYYEMTIIGFVRDTGTKINTDMEVRTIEKAVMKIYTHPERIVWE